MFRSRTLLYGEVANSADFTGTKGLVRLTCHPATIRDFPQTDYVDTHPTGQRDVGSSTSNGIVCRNILIARFNSGSVAPVAA